jgi:WD40 repeat protein/ribosomal protein S18 acetylase RimI-like enzyme
MPSDHPKVFISYSHDSPEHAQHVMELAERLRQDGVDAQHDQSVGGTPDEGWPRWMLDKLDWAEFVLMVCTETYYRRFRGHDESGEGKGADWEGNLITLGIYVAKSRTTKFVPVLFGRSDKPFIPEPLLGHSHYMLDSADNYAELYAFLTGQAGVLPSGLGSLQSIARKKVIPLNFVASGVQKTSTSPPEGVLVDTLEARIPDISAPIGRRHELKIISGWVQDPQCRLIAIVGVRGIGKTSLAARLAHSLQRAQPLVEWRRMVNPLSAKSFLTNLLVDLDPTVSLPVDRSLLHLVKALFTVLRGEPRLIVIDNVETVLCFGSNSIENSEVELYREIFTAIATQDHNSTWILTSREMPSVLDHLFLRGSRAKMYTITGLSTADVRAIFRLHGRFSGTQEQWERITRLYAGNAFAVTCAAKHIKEVFSSNIATFLAQGAPLFTDIEQQLNWHVDRLSTDELSLLYWLAAYRTPISAVDLLPMVLNTMERSHVFSAFQGLQRRLPLEKLGDAVSLHPVMLEHVTTRFAVEMANAFIQLAKLISPYDDRDAHARTSLGNTHALMLALSPEHVRDVQRRSIVGVVKRNIEERLGGQSRALNALKQVLNSWKLHFPGADGYLAANILHLISHGSQTLDGVDVSGSVIRQCVLHDIKIHSGDLRQVEFSDTLFRQVFDSILSIAFLPGQEAVALGDTQCNILVYRIIDGELTQLFKGHEDWVRSLVIWEERNLLISASDDKSVRCWDIRTGRCSKILKGHEDWVWSIAINKSEGCIITGSHDGTVRSWDETGQDQILMRTENPVVSVACAPNGATVIACTENGELHVRSRDKANVKLPQDRRARAITFSPCGRFVVCGFDDCLVKIFDSATMRQIEVCRGHTDWIWTVMFSGNGQHLLTAGGDGVVRVWRANTWQLEQALVLGKGCIRGLAVSHDAKWLVAGCGHREVQLWDVIQGQTLRVWRGYNNAVRHIDTSPCGKLLAGACGDNCLRIWDSGSGRLLRTFSGHRDWIWCVAFSPDGSAIATGSNDRTVRVWKMTEEGSSTLVFEDHLETVWDVAFSPSGDLLASACEDGCVRVWNIPSGALLAKLVCNSWALSVAVTSDEQVIVGTYSGKVEIFDLRSKLCRVCDAHSGHIWSLAINERLDLCVTGGQDGLVCEWGISSLTLKKRWSVSREPVRCVDISPNGEFLISGGQDGIVRLHDRKIEACTALRRHKDWVRSVRFFPDGDKFASGSEDETAVIWSVPVPKMVLAISIPRPYEGTNIYGCKGVSQAQRDMLLALGCYEQLFPSKDVNPVVVMADVHILKSSDWKALRRAKCAALRDAPKEFEEKLEDFVDQPDRFWINLALEHSNRHNAVLIAWNRKEPIGMITVKEDHLWTDSGYLGLLWVSRQFRRNGVATALFRKALELLRNWGLGTVRFCVSRRAKGAIALYRKEGFRETGVVKPLPSDYNVEVVEMFKHL